MSDFEQRSEDRAGSSRPGREVVAIPDARNGRC